MGNHLMSSQRGVFHKDRMDVQRADAMIINLLGAEKVSIGTVMEIGWANAWEIPVVLVMEKEGNVHDHCMIREACPFHVESVEEACQVVTQLVMP